MEEASKFPLYDGQTQPGEKSEGLATTPPTIKSDPILRRDKTTNGNLQRRTLTRKTVSEGLLERSRKVSIDAKTYNLGLLAQRPRAISNLETAREKGRFKDKLLSSDGHTTHRRVASGNVSNVQRQRKISPLNEQSMSYNRSSSKGQEKWAVRRTSSNELAKRKIQPITQSLLSISTGGRRDAETESLVESRTSQLNRHARSSLDGEKYKAKVYMTGSLERREIIEKYLKDTTPKIESLDSTKKTNKLNNGGKSRSVTESGSKANEAATDVAKGTGEKQGTHTALRGWQLVREKLYEIIKLNERMEMIDVDTDVSSKTGKETESTEKYLKMLRERLRKCQPADIVASSNVGEITKLRKDIERKRSVVGQNKKNSFFETVLTAHALSKQNTLYKRPLRKTSLSRISETNDLFQSLPSINYNIKFKSSPHFQKTVKLLAKHDIILEKDR